MAALIGVASFGVLPASAAEVKLTPSLAVTEEFNDNVRDSATARRSDFITRVQPGVAFMYRAPSVNGDLSYSFDYQNYARGTVENEENHNLNLRATAEVVKNFFFLELSDTLSRVSLDVTRDVTTESLYANQTDQNRASVSPYLVWRLGEKNTLKTGYRFNDTSYWGSPGIDKREHRAFAEFNHDPTARLNLNLGYAWAMSMTEQLDYDQHDLHAGFRYEYLEKSFLFGGFGNSWQAPSVGSNVSNPFWNAGISRDFGHLSATLETRVEYTEDPLAISTKTTSYNLSMEKPLQHGAVGLSSAYRKYVDTLEAANRERRKAEVGGFWRGELTPRLNATVTVFGDKVSRESVQDYAYHLNSGAGLSYSFNYDITASLNYSYIEYRRDLENSANARQTNRVILSLRKVF